MKGSGIRRKPIDWRNQPTVRVKRHPDPTNWMAFVAGFLMTVVLWAVFVKSPLRTAIFTRPQATIPMQVAAAPVPLATAVR